MGGSAPQPGRDTEASLRARLGIPAGAKRVIVFAESSHWDPNWRLTSGDYFRRLVGPNLDKAVSELLREPRRVYSIECVFFLRLYWEGRPRQQDAVRQLVNEGRLRLTSSGVTTADTILPRAEAILRDLLLGQEWLRSNGMVQETPLAYFPDSFGGSPALPSLLRAAGFSQAAMTHIDGALHPSSYHEVLFRRFPRPGSSAARLMKQERCLDFIWRGRDGAEVLCHWNRHGYNQGDTLAYRGLGRGGLNTFAIPDPSDRNVSGKVRRFARQLIPYSRTPYLFCAIGGDFIDPTPDLVALLDRYNQRHYPSTGVWAVNAGLDDYLALVDCHREVLPVLELDPNPCWTGFYATRPTLKRKCRDLVDLLLLAEQVSLLPQNEGQAQRVARAIEDAWWHAAASNHHDFITGTAADSVVRTEQEPWLDKGIAEARAAMEGLAPPADTTSSPPPAAGAPACSRHDGVLEITTPHYVMELAEGRGGSILRARRPGTQAPLLSLSNYVVSYRDSGGLWRMGHEYLGGWLREAGRSCDRPARLEVSGDGGRPGSEEGGRCLQVSATVEVDGQTVRQVCQFRLRLAGDQVSCGRSGRPPPHGDRPVRHGPGPGPPGHGRAGRHRGQAAGQDILTDLLAGPELRPLPGQGQRPRRGPLPFHAGGRGLPVRRDAGVGGPAQRHRRAGAGPLPAPGYDGGGARDITAHLRIRAAVHRSRRLAPELHPAGGAEGVPRPRGSGASGGAERAGGIPGDHRSAGGHGGRGQARLPRRRGHSPSLQLGGDRSGGQCER